MHPINEQLTNLPIQKAIVNLRQLLEDQLVQDNHDRQDYVWPGGPAGPDRPVAPLGP